MIKSGKKKFFLFLLYFILVFFIYWFTLSDNMMFDSDYLQMVLAVEGLKEVPIMDVPHIIWIPLGKLAFNFARFWGYTGGAAKPIEVLNIFLASVGSSVFLILIYELTGSLLISICLSVLLSFSFGWWMEFVHTKLYSGGFLFNILSFYLYTKNDLKIKPVFIAVVNSLAVLFHITNLGIIICSIVYFFLEKKNNEEKRINVLLFLLTCISIVSVSYLIFSVDTAFGIYGVSEQGISWLNFLKNHYYIFLGNQFQITRITPRILTVVFYLALSGYLLLISLKKILRNQMFYCCLIFGILLVSGLKIFDAANTNFSSILIPFNIILALTLKDYKNFGLFKKLSVCIILIALSGYIFGTNVILMYYSRDINSDFFYSRFIAKSNNIISSKDVVFTNSFLSVYMEYYLGCRVNIIRLKPDNLKENEELVKEIELCLRRKENVKLVLETEKNYSSGALSGSHFDYLLKTLSENFNCRLIYESEGGERFGKMLFYKIM